MTFTVQHARSLNIVVSLRGNPREFLQFDELALRDGMGNGVYTECALENISQLPAVAMHIRKAHDLYMQGRARDKKQPTITNV